MKTNQARQTAVDTQIVTITPELAEEWLGKNSHNRPIRNRKVEELKQVILRGEWMMNGDAIRFDQRGTLIDGQHRLWAISLAGKPVPSLVVTGLPAETQLTIDYGTKRRLSDHLKLMGYPSAMTLGAIINMKWKIDNGLVRTSTIPTPQQALAVLQDHPDIVDGVAMSARWRRRLHGSTAGVGALYYEFSQRDPDAAFAFFEGVIDGVGLEHDSPLYVLRKDVEMNKHGTVMMMALMIKAWNAYLAGQQVNRLYWRPVGKRAEPFPTIDG